MLTLEKLAEKLRNGEIEPDRILGELICVEARGFRRGTEAAAQALDSKYGTRESGSYLRAYAERIRELSPDQSLRNQPAPRSGT